jgi:ferredoxin-NADP reductase
MIPAAAGPLSLRVLSARSPAAGTRLLRLERGGLDFWPGQYFALAVPAQGEFREYTVCSGAGEPWLEFLVREVGPVSRGLAACRAGDTVLADGPCGFFTLDEWGGPPPAPPAGTAARPPLPPPQAGQPRLFLASGVAVAAFRSMVRTWPGLDCLLVHGVRCAAELYGWADFAPQRRLACLSGPDAAAGAGGGQPAWPGRLSAWLDSLATGGSSAAAASGPAPLPGLPDPVRLWGAGWPGRADCWLAGNSDMIHDAWDRLASLGVSPERIHTESFF